MTLFVISFIAGVLTVLAPCVLPLLPVIIGGSIADGGNRRKSYTIIGSLIISLILFTLILKWSTAFISVPPNFWSVLSGGIIVLVALTMLFPQLWSSLPFVNKISIKSNKALGAGYQKKSFWGDVIVGAALGPVFSSCSPTYFVILATVLPQSFVRGLIDLFAYSLGLGFILLLVSILGQKLVDKLGSAADPNGRFKKIIGALFLVVGIFILTGLDKKVQTELVSRGFVGVAGIEEKFLGYIPDNKESPAPIINDVDMSTSTINSTTTMIKANTSINLDAILMRKQSLFSKYREIVKPGGYVNTGDQPIKIADYVGKKVILLDVMTYSCINCQRTFPYVVSWFKKYEDQGLIIIGIHTPEFAFEHDIGNVTKAMQQFGIKFPIVLDNEYGTWNAYGNRYWPRKYLIDIDGYVVYDHIGEGDYNKTEEKIVELLKERADRLGGEVKISDDAVSLGEKAPTLSIFARSSPETYLGSARNQFDVSQTAGTCENGVCTFTGDIEVPRDRYALTGTWNRQPEFVELAEGAGTITYRFNARKVFLVAESSSPVTAQIYVDGKPITTTDAGEDVIDGRVTFNSARLYTLINMADGISEHTLEIKAATPGLKAYAFTFGSN
jgi:cytochrome c biogenesis protein CcdA/thiol-disulfide isomerase/thioredoxin